VSEHQERSSTEPPPIALTLFIAATSPSSSTALLNIRSALDRFEGNRFALAVIDVFEHPLRALESRILITPTLLAHACTRRVVGDLGDPNLVDYFLQSVSMRSEGPSIE
jgi:hypothetical protein